jgi:hypothetical protein
MIKKTIHDLRKSTLYTRSFLLPLSFTFFLISTAQANTIYVNVNNNSGTYNGLSWATAFNDFQSGINTANAGDTVWIAQGIYQPLSYGTAFSMKSGVSIYGGFTGTVTKLILLKSLFYYTFLLFLISQVTFE